MSLEASFPIVVVFPVPLTPTTRITEGRAETDSVPGSPSIDASSSSSRSRPPRSSSRRTSSAVAGTPTSAPISASSSRSHASSAFGSNPANWWVSARRERDSESRSRPKKPACSSADSSLEPSPSSSPQERGIPRSGYRRRDRILAGQPPRDDLRDAVAAHRHAVQRVGGLHRALLVGDDDELRAVGELAQERAEAADVRIVERRLDLVEEVERARPREEEREQERDRPHRLLAAREE